MSLFTKLGNDIASPVDAAGNYRSVDNIDFQRWMTEVERVFSAFQAGGGIIFPDLATANASLAYAQNQMAWVMGDPTPANNGVYRKIGASGSGSWARMGDLPFAMIPLANAGAGTADAIVATPMLPLPTAPGAALLTVNILADNTGPVTINGKPLRTNSGNEIAAGGLTTGSIHAFLDLGAEYRLLSDQASAAIVAAAEAQADRAADAAQSVVARAWFKEVSGLLADDNDVIGYAGSGADFEVEAGDEVSAGGYRYEVAASDATDGHVETAGGVKLYVLRVGGKYNVNAWGVISDSTDGTDGTIQTTEMLAIVAQLNAAGYRGELYVPYGTKFDKVAVYDAANPGIIFDDDSLVNWYNSPSYKMKIRNYYSSDLVNDDTATMLSSNHHTALFLMNFGTAGSASAAERFNSILYGAGVKPNGEYITGLYQQVGGISNEWAWRVMLQTPFDIATKVKPWAATTAYNVGDIVVIYPGSGRVYECTVAGTSGVIAPSHTSSTATDGTVTWLWRQNNIETGGNTIWRVTESGNTIQSNTRGGATVTHQMSVGTSSGFGGYTALIVADDQNNTTSLTAPLNGTVNIGRAGAPASNTVSGVSVFNGTGNNTIFYAMNGSSGQASSLIGTTEAAASTFISFRYNGGSATGSISHNGSGTTAYNTTSDARLKTNARDFDSGSLIDALEVWQFDWTHGRGGGFGVMAQDAHEVFPDAVTPGKGEPGDEEFEPWSVDYSKFAPLLLREIRQLRRRIADLEAAVGV